jgi:hypothetical protein
MRGGAPTTLSLLFPFRLAFLRLFNVCLFRFTHIHDHVIILPYVLQFLLDFRDFSNETPLHLPLSTLIIHYSTIYLVHVEGEY